MQDFDQQIKCVYICCYLKYSQVWYVESYEANVANKQVYGWIRISILSFYIVHKQQYGIIRRVYKFSVGIS